MRVPVVIWAHVRVRVCALGGACAHVRVTHRSGCAGLPRLAVRSRRARTAGQPVLRRERKAAALLEQYSRVVSSTEKGAEARGYSRVVSSTEKGAEARGYSRSVRVGHAEHDCTLALAAGVLAAYSA